MTELSIAAAARQAGDRPAIITRDRTLTFADCAAAITHVHGAPAIIATPGIDTILAVHAALEAQRPLALIHAKLPPDERARQLAAVDALPGDTAFVLFTSGTTGSAKGVVLSRAAIVAAANASAARLHWRDDDRWLSCLPMAHAGGLSIVVRCLIARRPVVLHDADFDAAAVLALATSARATLASFVPAQLAAFAGSPPPSLRAAILGGAAAAPSLVADAVARGWPILPSYGLTETFGQIATALEPGGPPVLLPTAEVIAGETLRVRGPMLATGYLGGAAIAPELVTADIGTVERGVIRVLGRRDDVIVSGGEKVHPLEIEAVLAATPGVCGACAFAIADERWGHIVGAAIAVEASFDAAAACARWHASLPSHARPRRLAIVTQLPLLASGKLDRRAIAALPTEPVAYAGDDTSTRMPPGAVR
ncbi:MAG TPA: AMP-binding protein [Kofleriaceae bacterium]